MSPFQAIVLGIVQGITEFLPISSSGHLVIVPQLFGWHFAKPVAFVFDVLVQMGTLAAVIIYFWDDLWQITIEFVRALLHRRPCESKGACLGWYLILATIPAVIGGLWLKDSVETAFSSPRAVGYFLFVTAALLVLGELVGRRTRNLSQLNWVDALVVGLFQVLALFPGVSRSGSTISGGMLRSLKRSTAARFSFLMSVPVMLGAGAVALKDLATTPALHQAWMPVLIGFLVALGTGYAAIRWLLQYLSHHSLYVFAAYCAVLGALVLLFV